LTSRLRPELQAAPRRVKSIYSVIASPQRLEILRILNTKGPLTYSALKALAGFKSKKESGKFAYHLRKLVRVMLIQLNRQERKYTVTNFGRMVLNVTKQIEDQSQVESGKLYVRTSRQTMEEFNANKITQSLVKEAGMPVELAQKITSEAESRIYKFQTQYLTAPLIREIVNSVLVEQNYEEYRHKLTRLGMPVYDVTQLLGKAGEDGWSIESLIQHTGRSVFSEYLLLEQLPRDVADAHLLGEMHISKAGTWGLVPDTVYVDLLSLKSSGFNVRGRIREAPSISSPENAEKALNMVLMLSSLLTREVSNDVVFTNFVQYLGAFSKSKTKKELEVMILRMLEVLGMQTRGLEEVGITLELTSRKKDQIPLDLSQKVYDAILDAYSIFVDETPEPKVRLVVHPPEDSEISGFYRKVSSLIIKGGKVAILSGNQSSNFDGISISSLPEEFKADNICVLHNLSLNLPRLAYDSNQDETYFRAKLAMLISTAVSALSSRRKMIERNLKRGLLPALASGSETFTSESMPMIINMVGIEETLNSLTKQSGQQRYELALKIAETASEKAKEKSSKGERFMVSMVELHGTSRLLQLDMERYGKATVQPSGDGTYSQTNLISMNNINDNETIEYVRKLSSILLGGISTTLDIRGQEIKAVQTALSNLVPKVSFLKIAKEIIVCKNCGFKLQNQERCPRCKSVASFLYLTSR
jgi:anaerobic ribonucleoside-triphosphate reductase